MSVHHDVFRSGIELNDKGLVLNSSIVLAPAVRNGQVNLEKDHYRIITLLSVAYKSTIHSRVISSLESAAACWQRGEKALANIRLIFIGLPYLHDPDDVERVQVAKRLIDEGASYSFICKMLNLDLESFSFAKFETNQPRVPAGSGATSGRWLSSDVSDRKLVSKNEAALIDVSTTTSFSHACRILGIDPIDASAALHAAKRAAGLGGADNCVFDLGTGDIFHKGEHIGNLGD